MIGKNTLTYDSSEFLRGMTTSDDIQDGGISPSTDAVQLLASPGVMYSSKLHVSTSTNPSANIIASTEVDALASGFSGISRVFIGTDKKYYNYNGTDIAVGATDPTSANAYSSTGVDSVFFNGAVYTSVQYDVTKYTGSAVDGVWWSATVAANGTYLDKLYIGDSNKIHRYDGTTPDKNYFTIPFQGALVTALGIDPSSGLILVSYTIGANAGNTQPNKSYVGYWNGSNTTQFQKIVQVDDQINSFYTLGGNIFVGYGLNFGYWNGNGIKFLRKLKNATLASTDLIYKNHIANIDKTLYVIDGTQVLAYGEIVSGQPIFRYVYKNSDGVNYSCIANVGSGKLAFSRATNAGGFSLDLWDSRTNATLGNQTTDFSAYTRKFNFPRPIWIRGAQIYADGVLTNGGIILSLIDDSNTTTQIGSGSLDTYSLNSSNTKNNTFLPNPGIKTTTAQFKIEYLNATKGLRRFIVYYDVAE